MDKKTKYFLQIFFGICGFTQYSAAEVEGSTTERMSVAVEEEILSRDAIVQKMYPTLNYNDAFASVDHKEVDKIFRGKLQSLFRDRKEVIIDRTNTSNKSRRGILGSVPKDYYKEAIVFATGRDEVLARNAVRVGKILNDDVLHTMMKSFMVPLYDQFDSIKWKI